MRAKLTQQYLKEILDYNSETGVFVWLYSPNGFVKVGDEAGAINLNGYAHIRINYRHYKTHRLAYLYMTGRWPKGDMDHKDQNKINNAWSNLRDCTHSKNMANRSKPKNNTSGFKGVSWHKPTKKWQARVACKKESIYLGLFDCEIEAAKAYNKKAVELFGEYAYINEIGEENV